MDNDEIQEFSVAHKRRYSKNHLWYQEKDDRTTIGVTDFISKEKGEVLRVVLPHAGVEVDVDEELFSIDFESGTVIFRSLFSGEIVEVNGEVEINPELVDDSPYEHGWCMIFEAHNMTIEDLMDPDEYIEYLQEVLI